MSNAAIGIVLKCVVNGPIRTRKTPQKESFEEKVGFVKENQGVCDFFIYL